MPRIRALQASVPPPPASLGTLFCSVQRQIPAKTQLKKVNNKKFLAKDRLVPLRPGPNQTRASPVLSPAPIQKHPTRTPAHTNFPAVIFPSQIGFRHTLLPQSLQSCARSTRPNRPNRLRSLPSIRHRSVATNAGFRMIRPFLALSGIKVDLPRL